MTFSIGVRTVFRPQNYVRQLVQRLAETGTLTHPLLKGFHVHHGEVLNPNMNGVGALRAAVADRADWVIFLEDDIDIIDDFIGSLNRWLALFWKPDIYFYPLGSFYASLTGPQHSVGMWEMPLDYYYGSQAVVLSTRGAHDYAQYLDLHQGAPIGPSKWRFDQHFDMHLSEWQRLSGGNAEFTRTPAPCFVDHIGENSLMGTWERTGRILDFAGREWSFNGRESERREERRAV